MQVLKLRQSSRNFDTKLLPLQELSNLLWAAYGINRPENGKRTAPSAMNWQEIDIYVMMQGGTYMYDAKSNSLLLITEKDLREATGKQSFVKEAPLNLVYIADEKRMTRANGEDRIRWSSADAGFIGQNVYLYCASQGLAVVVRGMVDRETLTQELKLRPEQKIILSQTVGYPKQ
jgi:SagB-type dehydrogenase family enzyme